MGQMSYFQLYGDGMMSALY